MAISMANTQLKRSLKDDRMAPRVKDSDLPLPIDKNGKPYRPRGTGKPVRALVALIESNYPNYDAILRMVGHAIQLSVIADDRPKDSMAQLDALTGHDKVAKYVQPQLKAVDLTTSGDQISFAFSVNLMQSVEVDL
jgi:hypothetical protein